jgi:serine/threonine protein kinase
MSIGPLEHPQDSHLTEDSSADPADGADRAAVDAGLVPPTPRQVGRYEIVRQIGRGGMAIVYLARQTTLDRDVALKELSSFHASTPEVAERFVRESQLAGSLNHPNIVTVYEYFEEDGIPYIAMEHVARGSLRQYVGHLTLAQLAGVMEGLLAGMAHAEGYGIVHRDLKPENLMVTGDGRIKIADFGIAKATQTAGAGSFVTVTGTVVGTPMYMAPEQAMGLEIGLWSDLYSVGVMAWEHLVGRAPFPEGEAAMVTLTRHVRQEIPSAMDLNPHADQEVSNWIDRLLVKDPAERTRSPIDAWDDLEEIIIARLGPRWRRDARLPSQSTVRDAPRPLTPAPFESHHARVPQGPATSNRAIADLPDSGYMTFGAKSSAAANAAPEAESTGPAGSTWAPSGMPPEPREVAPEPPAAAPEPPATPAIPLETPDPPPAQEPPDDAYITYGQPRMRDVPLEPEPQSLHEATPPIEVPIEPAEPAPVMEPVEPAPVMEPVEPAPVMEPAVLPPLVEPVVLVPRSPRVRPRRERTVNATGSVRAALLTVAGLVAAAAIGFVVAPSSGGSTSRASSLAGRASSGPISVSVPAGWRRQAGARTPHLALRDEIVLTHARPDPAAAGAGGTLVLGTTRTTDPSLLPADFRAALPSAPTRQQVALGSGRFFRYLDLTPSGAGAPETVYAAPTTKGTVIGACLLEGAAASFPGDCERVIGSLRLGSGRLMGLGPNTALAARLSRALTDLNAALSRAGGSLGRAHTPNAQSRAAQEIADSYGHAAATVDRLTPIPTAAAATAALSHSLRKMGAAFAGLGHAAAQNDRRGYGAARGAIQSDAAAISAALQQFVRLGYSLD